MTPRHDFSFADGDGVALFIIIVVVAKGAIVVITAVSKALVVSNSIISTGVEKCDSILYYCITGHGVN